MTVTWSSHAKSRGPQTYRRCQHGLVPSSRCHAVKSPQASDVPQTWTMHSWRWHYSGSEHGINYAVAGCGPPIILVHGFGASCGQWRNNIPRLAETHKVYAIDLLGFGASDKSLMNYTIELWAELVSDFAKEFVEQPFVLMGNSIGSLISLQAAKLRRVDGDTPQPTGIVLINCAGGMNNKARVDDWRIRIVYPLFLLLDVILKTEIIAARLFNSFRTAENVREVLKSVYVNSNAVDDELVDIICKPADDPNALAVLVSVVTGPPGPRPEDLMGELDVPVLVLWGDSDILTPVDVCPIMHCVHMCVLTVAFQLGDMSNARSVLQGPVGKYFMNLPDSQPNVTFELLENTGHCASP